MNEPIKLPLSDNNLVNRNYLTELQDVMKGFLKPRAWWQQRISVKELAELCELIASARQRLWIGVYAQYPQCREWPGASVNGTFLYPNATDEPEEPVQ